MAPGMDCGGGCILQQGEHGQVVVSTGTVYPASLEGFPLEGLKHRSDTAVPAQCCMCYIHSAQLCAEPFQFGSCVWQARETIQGQRTRPVGVRSIYMPFCKPLWLHMCLGHGAMVSRWGGHSPGKCIHLTALLFFHSPPVQFLDCLDCARLLKCGAPWVHCH